jgi:hypothetical protein
MTLAPDSVEIALSNDEALVLFEWLARFNAEEREFEDQAEQRVLWDLEAVLETRVPELFSPNYAVRVAEARARVRDADD